MVYLKEGSAWLLVVGDGRRGASCNLPGNGLTLGDATSVLSVFSRRPIVITERCVDLTHLGQRDAALQSALNVVKPCDVRPDVVISVPPALGVINTAPPGGGLEN